MPKGPLEKKGVNLKPNELPWLEVVQSLSLQGMCVERPPFVLAQHIPCLQAPAGRWAVWPPSAECSHRVGSWRYLMGCKGCSQMILFYSDWMCSILKGKEDKEGCTSSIMSATTYCSLKFYLRYLY